MVTITKEKALKLSREHYAKSKQFKKLSFSAKTKDEREEYWRKYLEEDEAGFYFLHAVTESFPEWDSISVMEF